MFPNTFSQSGEEPYRQEDEGSGKTALPFLMLTAPLHDDHPTPEL